MLPNTAAATNFSSNTLFKYSTIAHLYTVITTVK